MRIPGLALLEIFVFLVGVSSRINGRLSLPRRLVLEGARARRAGLLLMVPLPLSFTAGLLIGGLAAAGVIPATVLGFSTYVEAGFVLAFVGGALAYAYAGRRSTPRTPEQ